MNTIHDRLRQIREYYCHDNNIEFANVLGISPQMSSDYVTGRRNPSPKKVEHILSTFPEVSKTWLVLGDGDMLGRGSNINGNGNTIESSTVIGNMGNNNSVNGGISVEQIIALYEVRIREKDEMIAELRSRIEDQRKYISLLSEEHKGLVHRVIDIVDDTNVKVTSIKESAEEIKKVGFELKGDLENER